MEKTYQIITDATADLNAELMQESGLEMLPMDVEIEGKRYSYAPVGGDLGEAEFYRAPWRTDLRRHGHCGHGAPSKAHP